MAASGPLVARMSGWGGSGGRGFEGNLVAEGLELADEVPGLAGGVEMALVPVVADLLVGGVRVVDQMSGDDEYRAGDGDQGFCLAAVFDDAPVAGAEEGVGAGGGVGGFAEGALELGVALSDRACRVLRAELDRAVAQLGPRDEVFGVGKRLMSAPISARMIRAGVGPVPGATSSFSARARAFAPPADGSTAGPPCGRVISSSVWAMSRSSSWIWAVRWSTVPTSTLSSRAWCSSSCPVGASMRAAFFLTRLPLARSARAWGCVRRRPAHRAWPGPTCRRDPRRRRTV